VYRSRKSDTVGSTKSNRFRSVEIGPGLCSVLGDQVARRAELASSAPAAAVLFGMPVRTAKRAKGRWQSAGVGEPLDRNTVSRDWHRTRSRTQRCAICRCTRFGIRPPASSPGLRASASRPERYRFSTRSTLLLPSAGCLPARGHRGPGKREPRLLLSLAETKQFNRGLARSAEARPTRSSCRDQFALSLGIGMHSPVGGWSEGLDIVAASPSERHHRRRGRGSWRFHQAPDLRLTAGVCGSRLP
jgi:hypothetical protein